MNAFFSGKNLKSKLLSEDETNQNIDFDMFYYNKLKGQNNTYYFIFQLCQLLNIGMLVLNWWATDAFLGGNFHSYGTDVIDYYTHVENAYVASETSVRFDPMCNAFPTKVFTFTIFNLPINSCAKYHILLPFLVELLVVMS